MTTPSALDGLLLPPQIDANVPRVTGDGKPTKWLLDQELFQRNFYTSAVTNLDGRSSTIETNYQTADAALQSQVTTVTATANGATASGQVYLAALSAPTGYSAVYGWKLTAGNQFLGMQATLDSTGNAGIAFYASQFALIDPSYNGGAPQTVFSYAGGVFTFNVPVEVRTGDIGANQITQSATGTGISTSSASITTTGGTVVVQVTVEGTPSSPNTTSLHGSVSVTRSTLGTLKTIPLNVVQDTHYSFKADGTNNGSTILYAMLSTPMTVIDTPSAGLHTYAVSISQTTGVADCSIILQEFKR